VEYEASTDEDERGGAGEEEEEKMPTLPDLLRGARIYVDPSISDKAVLERYIIAYNGLVLRYCYIPFLCHHHR